MMDSQNHTPVGKATLGHSNGKQQLSSGLKERLKRCGRYHNTPPSAKRPCLSTQRGNDLSTNVLAESPTVNIKKTVNSTVISTGNSTYNSERETSSVNDTNTTPKPLLKSCSRKVNTTLSFQSPVLKSVINNSEEEAPAISDSPCATPLPDGSPSCTPLSSKFSQGRKVCVRNKNKLFGADNDNVDNGGEVVHLRKDLKEVKSSLAVLEEKLRKLKMVKMYRSKNNLDELQKLIDKWRSVSQDAITDLHQLLPEPRPSLAEFLNHLQVDTELVQIQLEDD